MFRDRQNNLLTEKSLANESDSDRSDQLGCCAPSTRKKISYHQPRPVQFRETPQMYTFGGEDTILNVPLDNNSEFVKRGILFESLPSLIWFSRLAILSHTAYILT